MFIATEPKATERHLTQYGTIRDLGRSQEFAKWENETVGVWYGNPQRGKGAKFRWRFGGENHKSWRRTQSTTEK